MLKVLIEHVKIRLLERVDDNMKYEYNGNLLEGERINEVANDIITKYPQIKISQAREIAMLEGSISTDYNVDMAFNRLYNIMLVTSEDTNIVKRVFLDLLSLLSNNRDNKRIDYYYDVTVEISRFLKEEREFPFLEEFEEFI